MTDALREARRQEGAAFDKMLKAIDQVIEIYLVEKGFQQTWEYLDGLREELNQELEVRKQKLETRFQGGR